MPRRSKSLVQILRNDDATMVLTKNMFLFNGKGVDNHIIEIVLSHEISMLKPIALKL